jgi:hypothetical protein
MGTAHDANHQGLRVSVELGTPRGLHDALQYYSLGVREGRDP